MKTEVVITVSSAASGLVEFLLRDITMPTLPGTGSNSGYNMIPLEIYTENTAGSILEAKIFFDYISPFKKTTSSSNLALAIT